AAIALLGASPLAVLVFEVVLLGTFRDVPQTILSEFFLVMIWGSLIGICGALTLYLLFRHHLAPEYLHNPLTLALVLGTFALSNQIQAESGLLAVTVTGILLGYQRSVPVRHILQFKENLQVLLISVLFILLASRLRLSDLSVIDPSMLLFIALLIFVVRPVAVWLSTIGSDLSHHEIWYLSLFAPRGIVAASVASIFSLKLTEAGNHNAYLLVPYCFAVIIVTVCFYGLASGPLARRLGVSQRNPQGTLLIGAHDWARDMARRLQELGIPILMLDRNTFNILEARRAGLPVLEKSCLAEDISEEIELSSYRRLLCLTSNDNVNALAQMRFQEFFDRLDLYQLPLELTTEMPVDFCGRFLFSPQATFLEISQRYARGHRFRIFLANEWQAFISRPPVPNEVATQPIVFFRLDARNRLEVLLDPGSLRVQAEDRLVVLCAPEG
ncbi:MAG TPA: NAD-binding protein, partial [Candidatus Ozemobacteraceae bacterium]|nr:NAD-binding protein [Candidatus Ozemobacteraceae bacterium]